MGAQREGLRSELGAHLCGGWWGSFPTPNHMHMPLPSWRPEGQIWG